MAPRWFANLEIVAEQTSTGVPYVRALSGLRSTCLLTTVTQRWDSQFLVEQASEVWLRIDRSKGKSRYRVECAVKLAAM